MFDRYNRIAITSVVGVAFVVFGLLTISAHAAEDSCKNPSVSCNLAQQSYFSQTPTFKITKPTQYSFVMNDGNTIALIRADGTAEMCGVPVDAGIVWDNFERIKVAGELSLGGSFCEWWKAKQ